MKWKNFTYEDQEYDLSHLHNLEFEIKQPAKNDKPEKTYPVVVEFSLHCFSTIITVTGVTGKGGLFTLSTAGDPGS